MTQINWKAIYDSKEGKRTLSSHIAEQGYCCTWGYITLALSRGETITSIARDARLPRESVRYHVHKVQKGKAACLGRSDCLKPIIEDTT